MSASPSPARNMVPKKLYNPGGQDGLEHRRIIKGDSTNLINLNHTKYPWTKGLYRTMVGNFWVPEKVDLTPDFRDYAELDPQVRRCFDGILSFLVFLDSLQTANLPSVSEYITAPEVSLLVAFQGQQEAVHSLSYAYLIETLVPKDRKEAIYEFWREDSMLYERNEYVASLYQAFQDEPNDANFWRMVVANYLLEGLYFYNGFNFFYGLAARGVCLGTSDMIRYINRDEYTHCLMFQGIINEIRKEYPEMADEAVAQAMVREAVDQEVAWTNHILGDCVLGVTPSTTLAYTQWLANQRMTAAGFAAPFPGADVNPYAHLERIADTGTEGSVKSNFFESTVTQYSQSSALDGWDDI
jgi:ribonucleoside-diphosphate reductase beta chain